MSRKMFVPFHGDGIISQFEGYEELEELDWEAYRAKYGNIQRLDRILRAEGDSPDRYKLAKQADTVMLFFLFSEDELRDSSSGSATRTRPDTARRTIDYYDRRTSHGSTLSLIAHAGVLAGVDPESSWERFLVALESDIGDIQGGTTREGIHLGVMSGTLDLVQRAYLGTEIRDGVRPLRPEADRTGSTGCRFAMQFRRHADQGDARGRRAHGRRPRRRRQPARQGRRRRRGAGAGPGRARHIHDRAAAASGAQGREAGGAPSFAARSSTSTACSSTRRTSAPGARRCGS